MIPYKTLALVEKDPNRTELCESHLVVKALTVITKIKSKHYLKKQATSAFLENLVLALKSLLQFDIQFSVGR